jgi:hypothetical protein
MKRNFRESVESNSAPMSALEFRFSKIRLLIRPHYFILKIF